MCVHAVRRSGQRCANRLLRRGRGAHRACTCGVRRRSLGRRRVALTRTVPAAGWRRGRLEPHQGHAADRRGTFGAARVGQGRRREHHDRRPGPQRPRPRRGHRKRHRARTAGGASRARRVAPGVDRLRARRHRRPHFRRAGRDVPPGVGHRHAEAQGPRTADQLGAGAARNLLWDSRFGIARCGHRAERGDPHRRVRRYRPRGAGRRRRHHR